jgi:hypothetical protein
LSIFSATPLAGFDETTILKHRVDPMIAEGVRTTPEGIERSAATGADPLATTRAGV